ncbi:MAG: hypothetical protein KJZ84_17590 [Bryobacteraceae bacterium]|nr:hypothetical protein [Bryobacteraceae bacterium]
MSSRVLSGADAEYAPVVWSELGPARDGMAPSGLRGASLRPERANETTAAPADWEIQIHRAREEGRREAESGARAAAEQASAALHARLVQSIEAIATLRPRLRIEAERQVVELALLVAKRILRREISIDPEAVAGLVRSALDGLSMREVLSIRCHPGAASCIRLALDRVGAPPAIRLEPDPSLEAGAVLVETTRGVLDASVTTQLEEIERGFVDLLEAPGPNRS